MSTAREDAFHVYLLDLDLLTPIAGGDDSDATAEAIAPCAGIALGPRVICRHFLSIFGTIREPSTLGS